MSTCDKTARLIAATRTRDLSPDEARFIREHTAACRECAAHLVASEKVAGIMHGLLPAEVSPPRRFDERLHERLIEQVHRPRWYRYVPSLPLRPLELAFLALLLFLAVTAALYVSLREEPEEPRLITERIVPAGAPISVNLEYLSVRPIQGVAVTIELGEGVAFHSTYPEVAAARLHHWNGDFMEGMNSIPFMVTISSEGVREIRTRADFEGWRHEHLITLTATGPAVSLAYYQLPPRRIP